METTPFLESNFETKETLHACSSLSSLERPRSRERPFLTSSPSRISTRIPCSFSSFVFRTPAKVDLPDPGSPVIQRVNPSFNARPPPALPLSSVRQSPLPLGRPREG